MHMHQSMFLLISETCQCENEQIVWCFLLWFSLSYIASCHNSFCISASKSFDYNYKLRMIMSQLSHFDSIQPQRNTVLTLPGHRTQGCLLALFLVFILHTHGALCLPSIVLAHTQRWVCC